MNQSTDSVQAVRLIYLLLTLYGAALLFMAIGSVFVFLHHSNNRSQSFWEKRREKLKNLPGSELVSRPVDRDVWDERLARDRLKEERKRALRKRSEPGFLARLWRGFW